MDLRVPGERSTESKSWKKKKQKMSWKKSDFASCSTIPSDREGERNLTTFVCILTSSRPIHLSLYDIIIIYRQNIILCKFNYLEALTNLSGHLILSIISELCEAVRSTYHRITFYSSCGAKTIKWLAACTGLCTVSHPVYHPPAAFSHASRPWLSLPTQAFAFTVCSPNGTVYLWNEIFVRSLLKKEWGILHFWFGFLPCFLHQCHWGNSSSSQVQEDRISKYYINNIFVYLSDRRDDNFSTIRAFMQLLRLLLRTEDI